MSHKHIDEEDFSEEEEEIEDLSSVNVINTYQLAATIANKVIKEVIKQCVQGKRIVEICQFGDDLIEAECAKVKKSQKGVPKGIGFPTCISVNNCVGHYSPLKDDKKVLANGDVVKVDLGVQIDGYSAVGAHTVIVGALATDPTTGKIADAICAAHYAMEGALRLIRPGQTSTKVTEAISKCAEIYGVTPVSGILSHDIKRYNLEGENVIFPKAEAKHQVVEFQANEVYCIDIAMSTGEGKSREENDSCTVYKRVLDQQYLVKNKSSKEFLAEVEKRYVTFPFTLRSFSNIVQAKLGLTECFKHNLISAFPVYYDKKGSTVVQFKTTVLVLPNGNVRIVGTDLPLPFVKSEFAITDPAVLAFLATPLKAPKATAKKTETTTAMETN